MGNEMEGKEQPTRNSERSEVVGCLMLVYYFLLIVVFVVYITCCPDSEFIVKHWFISLLIAEAPLLWGCLLCGWDSKYND